MNATNIEITFRSATYKLTVEPAPHGTVVLRYAQWTETPVAQALLHRIAAEAILMQANDPSKSAYAYVERGCVRVETLGGTDAEMSDARRTLIAAARAVK